MSEDFFRDMEKPLAIVTDWNAKGIVVPKRYIFHTLLERLDSKPTRQFYPVLFTSRQSRLAHVRLTPQNWSLSLMHGLL